MTIYIYIAVILINLIYSVVKKKSKMILFISFILILLLISGAGENYNLYSGQSSLDYANYSYRYNNITFGDIGSDLSVGQDLIFLLGRSLNIPFIFYRLILYTVGFLLINKYVLSKLTYEKHLVIALYTTFPMILDSEQLKNFLAMTIVLISLSEFISNEKNGVPKYILGIIIASLFHISALYNLIFIFSQNSNRRKIVWGIFLFTASIILIIIANDNQVPFISILTNDFNNQRIENYLTSSTNFGFFIPLMYLIMNIFLSIVSKKMLGIVNNSKHIESNVYENELFIVGNIVLINLLTITFIPFTIMNLQFRRLFRNILIVNYVSYSIVFYRLSFKKIGRYLFAMAVILSIFAWFYIELFLLLDPEALLLPFFNTNYFFN